MKKIAVIFCIAISLSNYESYAQGMWAWMTGPNSTDASVVYGTQGVPSVNNHPQCLYSPYCWTDLDGNFWLYGGNDVSFYVQSDLWKFNPSTLEWTWVNGNAIPNTFPIYGTKGVSNPSNTPGARGYNGIAWTSLTGDLWLYGGSDGFADMWKYTISTNEWTWMSGTNVNGASPVYGTEGIPSTLNIPGCWVETGNPWVDLDGNFWMYGGGVGSDMWMFNPSTLEWTWQSGNHNDNTSFGTLNEYLSSNTPGGGTVYSMWTANNGDLYGYGGFGGGFSNNLWKYNTTTNQWAWVNGGKDSESKEKGGDICEPLKENFPGARMENRAAWKDDVGNFWMYGGWDGEMWVYLINCDLWMRMSDSLVCNGDPVYGAKGIPSTITQPGASGGCGHWKDNDSNFWILSIQDMEGSPRTNLWKYVPDLSCINQCAPDTVYSVINIPTAFTPNYDGHNDYFRVLDAYKVSDLNVKIFNRWGELIFESADPYFNWDGKFKGNNQSIGVYVYEIECSLRNNTQKFNFKGSVTLLR